MTLSDQNLIALLKKEDQQAFQSLYTSYFPTIKNYTLSNSGNLDDAEDMFQESIIVLLQKVRTPEFTLSSSLQTFLFAIAKNLWLKRLRNNKFIIHSSSEIFEQESVEIYIQNTEEVTTEEKLNSWLAKITDNCQRILRAIFYSDITMENLMQKMGWKNRHTAANQQYKCIQQVKRQKDKDTLV